MKGKVVVVVDPSQSTMEVQTPLDDGVGEQSRKHGKRREQDPQRRRPRGETQRLNR